MCSVRGWGRLIISLTYRNVSLDFVQKSTRFSVRNCRKTALSASTTPEKKFPTATMSENRNRMAMDEKKGLCFWGRNGKWVFQTPETLIDQTDVDIV
jgi:hypothetical protein